MRGGMNQSPPAATISSPVMMPPFVPQLGRQPTGRHRHQEVAEVVCELHPGRLGLRQVQFVLKVLVHHVDHAVAESPEEKQRADQDETVTTRLLPLGPTNMPGERSCELIAGALWEDIGRSQFTSTEGIRHRQRC